MANRLRSASEVSITPYEDGPLLVRGDFVLRTPTGETIEAGRGTVALCRCGKSGRKPFCDGTHKLIGFRAGAAPDPVPDGGNRIRQATPDPEVTDRG